MSSIVEFKNLPGSDDENFVAYESLMIEDEVSSGPSLEEKAQELLAEVELKAEEILAKAKEEAKQIEQDAHDKGYQEGKQAGEEAGAAKFAEQISNLDKLMATVSGAKAEVYGESQAELFTLLLAMVEKLVYHEVSVNNLVIGKCLNKVLNLVIDKSRVIVHLSSDDFLRIQDSVVDNPNFLGNASHVELMEDSSISDGGCLLETDFGEIDATLENSKEKLYKIVEQSFLSALAEV